ncbi:MAG: carbon-nitrogen family hydrolase [Candidatus Phosphoribacter sp.]
MRVAVVQIGYSDEESMADRVRRVAALVRGLGGHDLVVLPELWSAGGFAYRRWAERAEPVDGGSVASALAKAGRAAGVVLHAGSIVERSPIPGPEGKHLWNTSLVFDRDGRELARYRKIHRFGFADGEPSLMEAGEDVVVVDLPLGTAPATDVDPSDAALPAAVRTGLSTCYDLRFPELYRAQLDLGAEMFVVPAAWPAARVGHWNLLARARAVENQCLLIACNTVGTHARAQMGGHSCVVLPTGEVIAEAGDDETILSVDLDPGIVAQTRASFPVLADRRLPPR